MDFLGLRNLSVIERALDLDRADDRASAPTSTASPSTTPDVRHAAAGATRSASSSSRAGPCARSCASLVPTEFDDVAALVALYRPGPWPPTCTRDYADRKNGRKPVTLPAPRHGADPGRHLRADDLPGVGHAGGPEVRRLHARGGRQPPQGVRQEDPRHHPGRAREVRRRVRDHRATAAASAPSCSTSSSPSPTTPSTSRTPTATGSSPTRPHG